MLSVISTAICLTVKVKIKHIYDAGNERFKSLGILV